MADVINTFNSIFYASGGIIISGTGTSATFGYIHVPVGGIILSGSGTRTYQYVMKGGVIFSDVSGVAGVPVAPSNVIAVGGTQQIRVQFDPVVGATYYNLYWSYLPGVTSYNGTKVSRVTNPYFHAGLKTSVTIYYVVTAVNSFGESLDSAEVNATSNASVVVYPNLPDPLPPSSIIDFPIVPLHLVDKLPSYCDKESYPLTIFNITNSDTIEVKIAPDHRTLIITKQIGEPTIINIKGTNISQIRTALTNAGFTLTINTTEYDTLLNHTLTNDPNDIIKTHIHFEQSLNIRYMNAIEQFMLDNINIFLNGLNEAYFKLADSEWLNLWSNYFGCNRTTGESDPKLLNRTINTVTAIKLNNIGIMKTLISELGLSCTIEDFSELNNTFVIAFNDTNVSYLPQDLIDQIIDVVNSYKAAGCFPVYTVPGNMLETNKVGEITNSPDWGTYPKGTGHIVIALSHS